MDTRSVLPCLNCDYDLTGIGAGRCPECGRDFTDADREMMRTIADIRRSRTSRWIITGIGWLAIVIGYSIGAGVLVAWSDESFVGAMLLAIAAFGALGCGWYSLLGCSRAHRTIALHVWRRQVWLLHLPWLVMAPAALVLAGVWSLVNPGGEILVVPVSVICMVVWVACLSKVFRVWTNRTDRELARWLTVRAEVRSRLIAAASWVYGGAILLGMLGGLVAILATAEFVGLRF